MIYEWYDTKNKQIIADFELYSELVSTIVQNLIDFDQERIENTQVYMCDRGERVILVPKDEIVNWAKDQI